MAREHHDVLDRLANHLADGSVVPAIDRVVALDEVPEVALALNTFTGMWMVGLLFFGLHLAAVASLLIGGTRAPKVLPLVLTVAGAAYVVDYSAGATIMLVAVALPSVIGEAWFGGWLLLRAGREDRVPSERTLPRSPETTEPTIPLTSTRTTPYGAWLGEAHDGFMQRR